MFFLFVSETLKMDDCLKKYAKCYQDIVSICREALPKVKAEVKAWHKDQCKNLQQCETPKICGLKKGKKPSASLRSCKNCISWAEAVEDVYFDPDRTKKSIEWNHVNASQFYHNSFEVAKVFIHYKECRNVSKFEELTPVDILRVMMHCSMFHKGNQDFYKSMKNVSMTKSTRTRLCLFCLYFF